MTGKHGPLRVAAPLEPAAHGARRAASAHAETLPEAKLLPAAPAEATVESPAADTLASLMDLPVADSRSLRRKLRHKQAASKQNVVWIGLIVAGVAVLGLVWLAVHELAPGPRGLESATNNALREAQAAGTTASAKPAKKADVAKSEHAEQQVSDSGEDSEKKAAKPKPNRRKHSSKTHRKRSTPTIRNRRMSSPSRPRPKRRQGSKCRVSRRPTSKRRKDAARPRQSEPGRSAGRGRR